MAVGELGGAGDRTPLEALRPRSRVAGETSQVRAQRGRVLPAEVAGLCDQHVSETVLPDDQRVEDANDLVVLEPVERREDLAPEVVAGEGHHPELDRPGCFDGIGHARVVRPCSSVTGARP